VPFGLGVLLSCVCVLNDIFNVETPCLYFAVLTFKCVHVFDRCAVFHSVVSRPALGFFSCRKYLLMIIYCRRLPSTPMQLVPSPMSSVNCRRRLVPRLRASIRFENQNVQRAIRRDVCHPWPRSDCQQLAGQLYTFMIYLVLSTPTAVVGARFLPPFCLSVCLFLSRLFTVDLIKPVSNVRRYVRPSTESVFDFNDIWHVGKGWWVMHDGMQYDPIQGQGQCHESLKVGNLPFSTAPPFTMGAGNWPLILKLGHNISIRSVRILIFFLVFVSRDFEVDRNVSCEESTVSPVRG